MNYNFIYKELLNEYKTLSNEKLALEEYIKKNRKILEDIYFAPKKIKQDEINEKINNEEYIHIIKKTICNINKIDLESDLKSIIEELGNNLSYRDIDEEIYIIIGLNTTTIYSTKYQNKTVTVILLESTFGIIENIKMLFAHEYTHWIRSREIRHDIFETCIGERFITEGIACNFSEEIVPNRKESYYCIVNEDTIQWVKRHMNLIDDTIKNNLNEKEYMYDFFYMFAKPKINGMPVRTGYTYGYLKVKEYLEKNNLKVKDIITIDWKEIL